jgi:hypothetical protein
MGAGLDVRAGHEFGDDGETLAITEGLQGADLIVEGSDRFQIALSDDGRTDRDDGSFHWRPRDAENTTILPDSLLRFSDGRRGRRAARHPGVEEDEIRLDGADGMFVAAI